jgi:hypothetical protein
MRTGRCLCGACALAIEGEPVAVANCHCLDCQRVSGAGHTTGAMFPAAGVRIEGPAAAYALASEAGNTVTRRFCARCGSPLTGENSGMPGFVTVALGVLDASDDLRPQVAIFARSRRAWDPADPSVQSYDAQPEWKPA